MQGKQESQIMSSKDKVSFNFRIIIGTDPRDPYLIQKKGWFFWNDITKCRTIIEAETELEKLVRHQLSQPGTIIKEYTQNDFLVDKLRGIK